MDNKYEIDVEVEEAVEALPADDAAADPQKEERVREILGTLTNNRGVAVTSADTPGNVDLPKYLYRCKMCHFVVFQDELPDGFICPNCGQPGESFKRFDLSQGLDLFGR